MIKLEVCIRDSEYYTTGRSNGSARPKHFFLALVNRRAYIYFVNSETTDRTAYVSSRGDRSIPIIKIKKAPATIERTNYYGG